MQVLRDTPTKSPADGQDCLEECKALGAIQVLPEIMLAALQYHGQRDNCSPLDELTMMEDYNHACVLNGVCWIVPNYLAPQA